MRRYDGVLSFDAIDVPRHRTLFRLLDGESNGARRDAWKAEKAAVELAAFSMPPALKAARAEVSVMASALTAATAEERNRAVTAIQYGVRKLE
ncbi:hypothetical protein OC842_007948, partial [Tilletia horrida]